MSSGEIYISDTVDVLEEIKSPNVHTVSWNIKAVDAFQDAISAVDRANNQLKSGKETARKTLRGAEISSLNLDVISTVMTSLERRLINVSNFLNYGSSVSEGVIIEPPRNLLLGKQKPRYSNAMPHIDENSVAIFISFNQKASGTLCIPREFAGSPDNEEGIFFESANKDQAISLPGASISIIDLGKQVHCSPDPSDDWRIVGRMVASL